MVPLQLDDPLTEALLLQAARLRNMIPSDYLAASPLHRDEVSIRIVEGLAAVGLHVQAMDWVPKISNLYMRGRVLDRIAGRFVPG